MKQDSKNKNKQRKNNNKTLQKQKNKKPPNFKDKKSSTQRWLKSQKEFDKKKNKVQ